MRIVIYVTGYESNIAIIRGIRCLQGEFRRIKQNVILRATN